MLEKIPMGEFEPRILGFTCNWCTYAAADLAGTSRMEYPPNISLVRIMCTGRINPEFILDAFKQGFDGVFIGGCHPGDCHYIDGNIKAHKRIALLKEVLRGLGLKPQRLRLEWISASEGRTFASAITDFVNELKQLGPNPLKSSAPPMVEGSR